MSRNLSCLLFTLLIVFGYGQELHFENVALKGLPSTEVYRIIQDADGFIWIATDAGVCKYDGNNLTTYTTENGLPENVVLRMFMDSKKRIWFNTLAGTIFYYEKERFITIAANPQLKKRKLYITPGHPFYFDGNQLKKVSVPFTTGDFYIGENDTILIPSGLGFIKIPPKNNYSQLIYHNWNSSKEPMIFVLQNKTNPTELIDGGLILNLKRDSIIQVYVLDAPVSISVKGFMGKYTRSYNNSRMGKDGSVYMNSRNIVTAIKNHNVMGRYCFSTDILKMYVDRDGDLWIGTDRNGVYLFKKGDLTKTPVHSLPSLSISSILMDKEGSIWVATLEKGIFQCMNKHVYTHTEKTRDFRLIDNQLNVIFESKKILVAPTFDSTRVENIPAIITSKAKFSSYTKIKQTEYYALGEETFSLKNKKLTEIRQSKLDPITSRYLLNLPGDTILGVNILSTFTMHDSKFIRSDINSFHINTASQLPDKRILFTSRSQAGVFEFKNGSYIPFMPEVKELKTRINCITVDTTGNLWFATNEKGIFCYDTHKQIHVIDKSKGLVSNKVNACVVAPNGDIWCGTHSGLARLIPSKGFQTIKVENYDKNHGVVDLEIEKLAYFDQGVWCGGKTTFFYFNPENMLRNKQPPVAYIKSISIKGENYPLKDSLFLNYDQNDFHVQYELISYKKTVSRSFFYKLNGFDDKWKMSNSGDIQYTNIGYGTYTLLIYAINNDGVRSSLPQTLTFVIKRPFWFTWWFITLVILLFLFLLYASAQYWRRKIEKKEHEKMLTNQKIAEFKMTALRSQMNPHFIFNAIGSIQHFILENEAKQSYNYLAKFSMLIRNILNNSREEYISLEQEVSTLQLYIELEQLRFTHPFKFILDIDEELDMETYIPTMLIQPYIENSIWHGLMPKESGGKLELIFKKVDSSIHVFIRDNGVGRQKKDASKKLHVSKGMSLTEQRIQTLESTSTKKFVTSVIDLKDEEGNPIGTEVNLIIPFNE
jgi:hypothetical protein